MGNKNRLQELLDLFEITAADMSRDTGLPKSSISMWLNGKREMRGDKVGIIAEHYHVDPGWLMGFDTPMHKTYDDAVAQLKMLSGDRNMELSSEEVRIIETYRESDEITRKMVLRTLGLERASQMQESKTG